MILKKVIENDKEIYVPISFEEAVKIHDKTQLVFSSEDEEDEFEEYLDELEEAEEEEEEDDDDENEDDDDDDKFFDINNLFSKSTKPSSELILIIKLLYCFEKIFFSNSSKPKAQYKASYFISFASLKLSTFIYLIPQFFLKLN